jgi:uncharacterized membrane protein YphA (DoxX/SURF4 family)
MVSATPSRAIAFARIVTGAIYFCEGFGKITGPFVNGGFAKSASKMAAAGYPFWRPILERFVVPHSTPFAWAVAVAETLIGLSLLSGLLVRWASIGGFAMMVVIGLGIAWPVAGAPWHGYVTAWLLQAAYAMLFLIFAATDAGRLWGLDARRRKSR